MEEERSWVKDRVGMVGRDCLDDVLRGGWVFY